MQRRHLFHRYILISHLYLLYAPYMKPIIRIILSFDQGGANASNSLMLPILSDLGMLVLPTRVSASNTTDNSSFEERVDRMADELLWYTEAFIEKRAISGPPSQIY